MSKFAEAMKEVNTEQATVDAVGAVGAILGQAAAAQMAIEGVEFGDGIPCERMFYSLGHCCQLLQRPPAEVREIMRLAEQKPAMALNDIAYWSGDSVVMAHRKVQELAECHKSN